LYNISLEYENAKTKVILCIVAIFKNEGHAFEPVNEKILKASNLQLNHGTF